MWEYRRRFFTLLFMTGFMLPSILHAQLDCDSAITIARDLISSAQVALDQNDPLVAANLMEQASIALHQSCTTADAPPTTVLEQTAEVIIPTEAQSASVIPPTVIAEATPPPEPPLGSVVNAPSVDVMSSVTFLRFVHTSIDSGPVDIYAQSMGGLLLVQNLQYDQFTDFIFLPSGQHTFAYRPAGSGAQGTVISSLSWNFAQDTSWMLALAGRTADYSLQVEPFTLLRGRMNGNARVRVVNWVSSRQRITVSSDQGVDFGRGLGWIGIRDVDTAPGVYHLTLTREDGQSFLASAPYEFAANTLYALMITGGADGNPQPHLVSIPSSQDVTRVRFVNNRGDTVDIHMRPGNQKIVEALSPGQMTDYLVLPNGAATFVAYAPGTGPRGQELAALIDHLRPARDLTVALQPDGSVGVTEVSWTPR